jgi:TatD DNase family protein
VWIDTHCHVQRDDVDAGALLRAAEAGVVGMVCVGTDEGTSAEAVAIAADHPGQVWATVGLHPHEARTGLGEALWELAGEDAVVAIGECGLDYHYEHSPRQAQREVFARQVQEAVERDLALVVHSRQAWDDTFDILAAGRPERVVMHCFTGGPVEARRALDLGAWISFSGIVTFKSADDVRAAAAMVPLDRLLVETDSPYLAPVPHRGRANEPALVPVVGVAVAHVRGSLVATVEDATWENAHSVFRLRSTKASSRAL